MVRCGETGRRRRCLTRVSEAASSLPGDEADFWDVHRALRKADVKGLDVTDVWWSGRKATSALSVYQSDFELVIHSPLDLKTFKPLCDNILLCGGLF
jgi:hypothetical protein